MRYANGDDHLHRPLAKQLYVGLPSESSDRTLGSDKAYLRQSQLTCEQSRGRFHLLQKFAWKEHREALHRHRS
jgi:hypothetical protein